MTDTDHATAYKLLRAGKHLKNLSRTINRFLNGKANGVTNDFTTKPGYLIVNAFSRRDVPPSCKGLIGETLYNQRAALDYFACELARVSGKRVDDDVEFPIFKDPAKFRNPVSGKLTRAVKRRMGLLHPKYQAIIEEEQPFQGRHGKPEDDPLWLLYCLSNYDRHQFIHITSVIRDASSQNITPRKAAARFEQVSVSYGAFERKAEVARFRILDGPSLQVEVNSNVRFDVAFGDFGPCDGRKVVATLNNIQGRIAQVFERLMAV